MTDKPDKKATLILIEELTAPLSDYIKILGNIHKVNPKIAHHFFYSTMMSQLIFLIVDLKFDKKYIKDSVTKILEYLETMPECSNIEELQKANFGFDRVKSGKKILAAQRKTAKFKK